MTDYAELIKALRYCESGNNCKNCPYFGIKNPSEKCKKILTISADVIEELQKRVQNYERHEAYERKQRAPFE